jgi:hypothetical protein
VICDCGAGMGELRFEGMPMSTMSTPVPMWSQPGAKKPGSAIPARIGRAVTCL